MVSSTTPRFDARCPPFLLTAEKMRSRISLARLVKSSIESFRRSDGVEMRSRNLYLRRSSGRAIGDYSLMFRLLWLQRRQRSTIAAVQAASMHCSNFRSVRSPDRSDHRDPSDHVTGRYYVDRRSFVTRDPDSAGPILSSNVLQSQEGFVSPGSFSRRISVARLFDQRRA